MTGIEESIHYENEGDTPLTDGQIAFLFGELANRMDADCDLKLILVDRESVEIDTVHRELTCSGHTYSYERRGADLVYVSSRSWVS